MNYLDLFHGIGGFALGAYWAGMKFENHYCSDIEPWCQKLYAQRFPESIQLGDITKIDAATLPAGEWILSGGFPCQDISIAGKGAGIHGDRSGLWFEYWRLIRDLRPRFAIMENVGMLVHRGLREVLGSLAEIGYDAEWQDIRASDMGAPHKRERIWIVAYSTSQRARRESGHICKTNGRPNRQMRGEFIEPSPESENMADPSITRLQGQEPTRERPGEPGLSAERSEWSTEPAVCGMADGISTELYGYEGRLANKSYRRVDRLKGLGNAIVPQIAEILFRQIKPLI